MQQEALCIAFESIVGKQNCITNPGTIKAYLEDGRGAHVGSTPIVLLPNSTGEISKILQICFENNIGVIPVCVVQIFLILQKIAWRLSSTVQK